MKKKLTKLEVGKYKLLKWILEDYGIVVIKEGLNTVGILEMVLFEKIGMKGIINFLGNIREVKVGDKLEKEYKKGSDRLTQFIIMYFKKE